MNLTNLIEFEKELAFFRIIVILLFRVLQYLGDDTSVLQEEFDETYYYFVGKYTE